jgi:hypothetical protein
VVTAEVTTGDERTRLFRQQADLMPGFDEYTKLTTREIPVVVLTPVSWRCRRGFSFILILPLQCPS